MNLIAYRTPDIWKRIFTFFIGITLMLNWLPFIRSIFDGDSYVWGLTYFGMVFGGDGITPDLLFLVAQLTFYVALMWSMFYAKNRTIFYGLAIFWFVNSLGNYLQDIIVNGDSIFHGDTLNIHISLFWIVTVLSVIAAVIIYMMITSDITAKESSIAWSVKNTQYLYIFLGLLPIQWILLAMGEPHATTDEIGVLISIAECFLAPLVYFPKKNTEAFVVAEA